MIPEFCSNIRPQPPGCQVVVSAAHDHHDSAQSAIGAALKVVMDDRGVPLSQMNEYEMRQYQGHPLYFEVWYGDELVAARTVAL